MTTLALTAALVTAFVLAVAMTPACLATFYGLAVLFIGIGLTVQDALRPASIDRHHA